MVLGLVRFVRTSSEVLLQSLDYDDTLFLEQHADKIHVAIDGRVSQAERRLTGQLLTHGGRRHKEELLFPLRLSPEGGPLVTPEEGANDLQRHFGEIEKAVQATN
eukprot:2765064-Pyramimonas_sp.AAC.1